MKIVFALLYYDEARAAGGAARYLELVPLHRELSVAMARAGHEVEVIVHFPVDAILDDEGVRFRFVAPGPGARAIGSLTKRMGRARAYYEPALRAIGAIARAGADVVHFHGTAMHVNLALLARRLDGAAALIVQYHGGGPAQNRLTRAIERYGLSRADRVLFTAAGQARPFFAAGVLDGAGRVESALEISSPIAPPSRDEARKSTGMAGDPVFVSAGRMHPDKDPLTMLRGFEIIARSWPEARLYLCYLTGELLPEVRRFVEERPALAARVHFLGTLNHGEMSAVLASADFLLQASLREVAGIAIVEAMAAGALPVITRIPAFEAMTDGGRHGVLFAPGDAEEMARGVLALNLDQLPARRALVQAHFEEHLSFAAMARRLGIIYGAVLAERRR
jgi:glycosyltransferase involved in cell wall biosynthesis